MTTKTLTLVAGLPRVNLLPPEIGERRRLKQVQAVVAVVVVAAIAATSYLYAGSRHEVASAKNDLASATAQNSRLTRQIQTYSNVKVMAAELAAAQAMLAQAAGTEVLWSTYLADLSVIVPKSTWLTGLTATESVAPGTLTSAAAAPSKIGTVMATGYSLAWTDLATYLDALHPENGLANPYFSKAEEKYIGPRKVLSFSSSTDVAQSALCAPSGGC